MLRTVPSALDGWAVAEGPPTTEGRPRALGQQTPCGRNTCSAGSWLSADHMNRHRRPPAEASGGNGVKGPQEGKKDGLSMEGS